jgi:hypothetical protein
MWRKDIVSWRHGETLYLSVPFTWLLRKAQLMAEAHEGRVVAGGPAVALMGAPWADHNPGWCKFDVLAFHNPLATYTTRGCPNACKFCAVPRIEGRFREVPDFKVAPMVCDNNFLAASMEHITRVVDQLSGFPWVDFNVLDARLFSSRKASQLFRLKHKYLRFSFENLADESKVHDAIRRAVKNGIKERNISVCVLYGFKDSMEETVYKMDLIESWNCLPYPMRFQPLDASEKNSFVPFGWTEKKLRAINQRYHKRFYRNIPFDEFNRGQKDQLDLFGEA